MIIKTPNFGLKKHNMKKEQDKKPLMVFLTDIQLHSNKSSKTQSFKRKIEKGVRSDKGGRCYNGKMTMNKDGELTFSLELPKEALGRKVVFAVPQGGLPITLGKDAVEKIKSLKKKKII